jgi:alanyl-tRNA synthetase
MTSSEIRQSFFDFFRSKQHTIVPSSSLMPDAPNLLFTNAGMNQFVPIFLGQQKPDVDKWPGAIPGMPTRAADTQKCIRAGGKHNDLDDVGLDTYHHTFFEMLGNWSFGDYFKKEAIDWAWELITGIWKFPPQRLYATVYFPKIEDPLLWTVAIKRAIAVAMGELDEISELTGSEEFDKEAMIHWARLFHKVGLDPEVQIVPGNRNDNFWMMGETGPCGPCSELHVDLTPQGNTRGRLVNKGSAQCIEIWNLVFIQFNANPDGTFSPLPARHVDTGMGFERVTSIIQGTKGLKDFANAKISNYETDIFRPIFDRLEQMSGRKYNSSLPGGDRSASGHDQISNARNPRLPIDIAFRVVADHIRTLSFAIADGIQPGNTDRNYVLRRILRRAVRYGRTLGFHEPFFYKLVDVLAETTGDVFPGIRAKRKHVQEVIRTEEEAFNKTLDAGIALFNQGADFLGVMNEILPSMNSDLAEAPSNTGLNWFASPTGERFLSTAPKLLSFSEWDVRRLGFQEHSSFVAASREFAKFGRAENWEAVNVQFEIARHNLMQMLPRVNSVARVFPGPAAFLLYDTYGFPLDLTELMARERGLTVDKEGFEKLMEEQRGRARAAQKKEVISLSQIETTHATQFVGFERLETSGTVLETVSINKKTALILDVSSFYAEMGGQVGDTGRISFGGHFWPVTNTQKSGNIWLHFVDPGRALSDDLIVSDYRSGNLPSKYDAQTGPEFFPSPGDRIELTVSKRRREAIQRHHTVTHIFHWALHEVVSLEASQKGSFVGPEKLTFDFNSAPLTPGQISDIEKLVNERILENVGVSWTEVAYADVKNRKDVMQFFGDKYGDRVRVVQIGGRAGELNGYSMELCGGTHTRATGEIGLFRIVGESAIAAGVRRIEAVAGLEAYRKATDEVQLLRSLAGKVNSPVNELEKKIESLLAHQKELEKQAKASEQREASNVASNLKAHAVTSNGVPSIVRNLGAADGDFLQAVADALKGTFKGVVVLGGLANGAVNLVATVSPDFTSKIQAGKIVQAIAPIVGGKGGGKPDNARGGGKDATKLDEALAKAKTLF